MDHYLALFEPDLKGRSAGYVATFPDFGYEVTQGETDEEARKIC
jgi:predicted RNase H-like HicB family nuclease